MYPKVTLVGLLVLALVSLGFVAMRDDEKEVTLAEVPAAVRTTITQHAQGATIKEIERETENGTTTYEIEIVRNGTTIEFEVAADGRFLGQRIEHEEKKIALTEAPSAVQAAVRRFVGANPISETTREIDDGVTEYEVEYRVNGVAHSISLAVGGELLEHERTIATTTLPAATRTALTKRFPNATVQAAEAVETHSYEIRLVRNGKPIEVTVLATGEIEEVESDDDNDDDDE